MTKEVNYIEDAIAVIECEIFRRKFIAMLHGYKRTGIVNLKKAIKLLKGKENGCN
jgi:hypothetical protein